MSSESKRGEEEEAAPTKPRLYYFRGRGRACAVRFMLSALYPVSKGGWDNVFVETPAAMTELRSSGKLLFNQLPMLEIDGTQMVQTQAIHRALARRAALTGKTEAEQLHADMIAEAITEAVRAAFMGLPFQTFGGGNRLATLCDYAARDGPIASHLTKLERAVAPNTSPDGPSFAAGKQLTYADLLLMEVFTYCDEVQAELRAGPAPDAVILSEKRHPALVRIRNTVSALPFMKAFLASDLHMPIGDDEYAAAEQHVLGRPPLQATPSVAPTADQIAAVTRE